MADTAELRNAACAVWAAGDFDAVAELVWEVGGRIVRRLEVAASEDVLDVACGTPLRIQTSTSSKATALIVKPRPPDRCQEGSTGKRGSSPDIGDPALASASAVEVRCRCLGLSVPAEPRTPRR
jgi:hypothetical protein